AHFENAQQLDRDGGKIYRLHDDGSVQADNPFVNTPGAIAAVWSHGHRNPQGLVLHPQTGELWEHEHGPMGGDEINIIRAGRNYGWPLVGYGIDYNGQPLAEATQRDGMEQPVHYWDPSIAPSGMEFITSDNYGDELVGHLLVGSLKFNYMVHLVLEGNNIVAFENVFPGIGRVRNIKQGPDGYIYVATEGNGILRIVPEEAPRLTTYSDTHNEFTMSEKLLAGYERFKKGYFADNREKLRQLAEMQRPQYALITCCDARMEPARIFDAEPGDLFVIRNVANLVPPYEVEGSYHGTSAAL